MFNVYDSSPQSYNNNEQLIFICTINRHLELDLSPQSEVSPYINYFISKKQLKMRRPIYILLKISQ